MKNCILILTALSLACNAANEPPKMAKYAVELLACSETSKTCEESIRCENVVRIQYNRAPRDVQAGCK